MAIPVAIPVATPAAHFTTLRLGGGAVPISDNIGRWVKGNREVTMDIRTGNIQHIQQPGLSAVPSTEYLIQKEPRHSLVPYRPTLGILTDILVILVAL